MIIVPAVVAEAYREASRSTLIVSDSYLVFFNSKEYRIVSFLIFSGGCNILHLLTVFIAKAPVCPEKASGVMIDVSEGLKNEDRS